MKYIISLLALGLLAAACTKTGADEQEQPTATALSQQIDQAIEQSDFNKAQLLIDSLRRTYPDSIDARTKALRQSALAVQGITLSAIPAVDARIARWQLAADSLGHLFQQISTGPSTGSYYLYKELNSDALFKASGIQPRLSPPDTPWFLELSIVGKKIAPHTLQLTHQGTTLATATMNDAAATISADDDAEFQAWLPEQALPIVAALKTAPAKGVNIVVRGTQGNTTIPVTPVLRRAILTSFDYASATDSLRQALIDREKLERRLITARNQLANRPDKE